MRKHPILRALSPLAAGALLLVAVAACSSKSPTEPQGTPAPPGAPPGATFNVSVSVSPGELAASSPDPAIVSIQVRRADNGQAPPDGTTAVVAASLGSFDAPGGPSSGSITLSNGSAQVQFFAGAVSGTAVIQAQISGSFGQATVLIREPETFFLAFVDPNVGSPQGGETVTIRGNGFEGPVRVLFGSVNAQVLSSSATQIRVRTPPSPSAPNQRVTVNVAVTINVNEEDQATDSLTGAFTYQPGGGTAVPTIFSVTPAGGPNEGGTRVVIVGDGFEAPVQVFFGLSSTVFLEAQVVSVTATRIEAISPAATGFGSLNQNLVVDVRVRNIDSGLQATLQNAFQYGFGSPDEMFISGISPNEGSISGLDAQGQPILVTVFGQGFVAPVRVVIAPGPNEIEQDVISVTGTEVVFRLRPIATGNCTGFSGVVRVTNLNTNEFADGPTFRYLVAVPLITGVSPNSGGSGGGTTVTVSGENFQAPVRVLFGGNAGTVLSTSSTAISVRTPAFTGTFPTEPCSIPAPVMGDPDIPGTRQLSASVAVQVINLDTGCTNTLPGGFLYVPPSTCVPTGGGGP